MSQYKPLKDCKTVFDVLEDPARWAKGVGVATDGCYCIDTAICFVQESYEDGKEKQRKLLEVVGVTVPQVADSIDWTVAVWDWNDAPERTHAEVLDAVRRAQI